MTIEKVTRFKVGDELFETEKDALKYVETNERKKAVFDLIEEYSSMDQWEIDDFLNEIWDKLEAIFKEKK